MLDEKLKEVLEMYPVEVTGVGRGRGAFVCNTGSGPLLLKAYPYSENHLIYESMLKFVLADRGYQRMDRFVYNKDGQLLTPARDGRSYVMKQWFEGRECDLKNPEQVGVTVKNLAVLHKLMGNMQFECEWLKHAAAMPTDEMFARRLRELKAIYSYMKGKKARNQFEVLYIQYYDTFCKQAREALKMLEVIDYPEMYRDAIENRMFCHGDYSHHHVLLHKNKIATINFDKAAMNLQICDLYYFLRKALEKNDWDIETGRYIIETYDREKPLGGQERLLLYALLLFPEKYWKIANHYYNSRKSWTSSINMEKLKKMIRQMPVRDKFLKSVFDVGIK